MDHNIWQNHICIPQMSSVSTSKISWVWFSIVETKHTWGWHMWFWRNVVEIMPQFVFPKKNLLIILVTFMPFIYEISADNFQRRQMPTSLLQFLKIYREIAPSSHNTSHTRYAYKYYFLTYPPISKYTSWEKMLI